MTVDPSPSSVPNLRCLPRSVWLWTGGSAILLFFCSSLRHALFQSSAFDLGWFDQAIYLLSQGQPPIVSFSGFHILGDHASVIFYPIALLYKIHPDVHWLFALQALALAGGIPLAWQLARQAGLSLSLASAVAFTYLLYPLVFNINLFDFHADVLVVPGIFGAVLALRSQKLLPFLAWILLILSAKAVLSLTLIAFGLWVILFEQRKLYGAIVTGLSAIWFLISTQVIFPFYTGGEHAAVGRYQYLGDSVFEIIQNLLLQPNLILQPVFSGSSFEYLLLLIAPVLWSFSRRSLRFILPILPQLALNLLSEAGTQRDLIHQYSLPILPFLILAIVDALVHQKGWFQMRRNIVIWMLVSFVALAKPGYFWTRYLGYWESRPATQEVLQRVDSSGGVLTISNIAPHLSHRSLIRQTLSGMNPAEIEAYGYQYVLLNARYPGWGSDPGTHQALVTYLSASAQFLETYNRDGVILFERRSAPVTEDPVR